MSNAASNILRLTFEYFIIKVLCCSGLRKDFECTDIIKVNILTLQILYYVKERVWLNKYFQIERLNSKYSEILAKHL